MSWNEQWRRRGSACKRRGRLLATTRRRGIVSSLKADLGVVFIGSTNNNVLALDCMNEGAVVFHVKWSRCCDTVYCNDWLIEIDRIDSLYASKQVSRNEKANQT